MRHRRVPVESAVLLLTAIVFFVASLPGVHLRIANLLYPSQAWSQRTILTTQLLLLAGMAALSLSIGSFQRASRGSLVAGFCRDVLAELRAGLVRSWELCAPSMSRGIALAAVVVLGAWVRASFLDQPMRFDEAWAFLTFDLGKPARVFDYSAPNNHVLHTVLVKLSTLIFGAHPASIRLPAFLAGVASIPAAFLLARVLLPWTAAFLTALAVAVVPYLILYSTNARGYSLIALWTVLLLLVGIRFARTPSRAGVFLLSALAALGMLTVPTMLFALAGTLCWLAPLLLSMRWPLRRVLLELAIPFVLTSAVLTLLLYLPVLWLANGLAPVVSNPWIAPQPWAEFVSLLKRRTVADFGRDMPVAAQVALLILAAVGISASARRREWAIALMLPAMLLGAGVLLVIHHATPYPRMWIYVIPILLLTAAAGFAYLTEKLGRTAEAAAAALLFAGGAFFAAGLVRRDAISRYEDTGRFVEADAVARYLEPILKRGDRVEVRLPAEWPTYFYLWYRGVPAENTFGAGGRTFFVIKKSAYSVRQMTDRPVTQILDKGDAAVYVTN